MTRNRYPGCRFDSESVSYGFSFSQEVLDEWDWTETFAPGSETLKYAQFLTDKFDLRKYMQFSTKIVSAHFQEDTRLWLLTDSHGLTYSSRFLVTALGILSAPTLPNIPGAETFKDSFHSSRWPEDGDKRLKGKRVGIIGTGATGIQIIQTIVKPEYDVKSLTVFQRTPNWSAPLRNESLTKQDMVEIRKQYPKIFEQCLKSYSGFVYTADTRKTLEVPEAERLAFWEDLYAKPGFAKWLQNFADINTDREANAVFSKFIADKIRQRVHDPRIAEKLIPRNHGFGTRRVPLETNYIEAYNDERVRLVDVAEDDPIERITETGIQLQSGEHVDLDILIFATGFDAVTGPFHSIDFQGVDGAKLKDVWADGPRTFLGLFAHKFPNMCMILGPHQSKFFMISRDDEFFFFFIFPLEKLKDDDNFPSTTTLKKERKKAKEKRVDATRKRLNHDIHTVANLHPLPSLHNSVRQYPPVHRIRSRLGLLISPDLLLQQSPKTHYLLRRPRRQNHRMDGTCARVCSGPVGE